MSGVSGRVLFLDAGGTLIEPSQSVGEIYARGAARFGVQAPADEVERGFREAFAASPPLAFPPDGSEPLLVREQAWWRTVVRRAMSGYEPEDFEAFFQALYAEFGRAESWRVFPDVVDVLQEMRARGWSLGVISNFDARLEPLLRGLGLAPYFDSFTFSSAAGWAKPDPRIFATALRRHDATPEQAVHAGDSEHDDVGGARAAGIHAVLVRTNGAGLDKLLAL